MLVNATASGNSVTKTGGCGGCADSGAVSREKIDSSGYVEFTVSATGVLRDVGLGEAPADPASMLFSIRLQGSAAEVRESGVYKSETPLAAGDVIRITVASGVVTYSHNGNVFFTSSGGGASLYVDVSLYDLNATVTNVMIATSSAAAPSQTPASLVPRWRAGSR